MTTVQIAIRRPIFITSIVIIILVLGMICYNDIGLDLLPDMSLPMITVTTQYPGSAPEEIDQLITKPLEDEFGAMPGLKHLSCKSKEGLSIINIEFNMDTDVDKVANDLRDKINKAKNNLPNDLPEDPLLIKYDPNSKAVIKIALESELPASELYDIANERVKPRLNRLGGVGTVNILGGTKREIQIDLDQKKINEYMLSVSTFVNQLKKSGANISSGKNNFGANQENEMVFRSMGEFTKLSQIENTLVSFSGNVDSNSVTVKKLGIVHDGAEVTKSIGYISKPGADGKRSSSSCIFLDIIKQSGSNTVKVAENIKGQIDDINNFLKQYHGNTHAFIVKDESEWIHVNIKETLISIIFGILLAVVVVYFFLGSVRSTLITAIAIPNSLLGAIIVMTFMGYTFNLLTLMGMSLVVGLLVDDAIVVRENIFRKLEAGIEKFKAAEIGTTEVMLAVIATTLAIVSVFFPVGMVQGAIGKLFKQFCFTIVFAMLVSLFDALTVAPFLSAYFAGDGTKSNNIIIRYFEKLQEKAEQLYEGIMKVCLNHPVIVIVAAFSIFIGSLGLLGLIKSTFLPTGDRGEFTITIDMPSGTSVYGTMDTMKKIGEELKKIEDLNYYSATAGNASGEVTKGEFFIKLKNDRKVTTEINIEKARNILNEFKFARPSSGSDRKPFLLVVSGNDIQSVETTSAKIYEKIKSIPELADVDTTVKEGSPELRIVYDQDKMRELGVSTITAGTEIRYNIAGAVVGKLRENALDYDIRARLKPQQRDLKSTFSSTRIPNSNMKLVPLSMVASVVPGRGSAEINRMDKMYTVTISANLAKNGAVGSAIDQANKLIKNNIVMSNGVTYGYSGESDAFKESMSSLVFAMVLGLMFIYFVLSSLYESFITPVTILIAIPPAFTGAFLALFLTGEMMNIFTMIGMIMLMGLVTKNSILLVDNAVNGVRSGLDRKEAILQAGIRRLRPILMTTVAMIAGTVPLALGIGEAAAMRQGMGIAIIGGLLISTLVTLVVIPAIFEVIDRFKDATESRILVRPPDLFKKKSNRR